MELGVSVEDISAMLLGGHGDTMVPIPSCTWSVAIPITQLLDAKRLEEIVVRTRNGGAEIVSLLKTAVLTMLLLQQPPKWSKAIVSRSKAVNSRRCLLRQGIRRRWLLCRCAKSSWARTVSKKIIELKLEPSERADLDKSIKAVRGSSRCHGHIDRLDDAVVQILIAQDFYVTIRASIAA